MTSTLPQRAVACKGWWWLGGMRSLPGTLEQWACRVSDNDDKANARDGWTSRGALPDIDDPATLGCMRELVRVAWRDPEAYTRYRGNKPRPDCAVFIHSDVIVTGGTEGEALVTALEQAPDADAWVQSYDIRRADLLEMQATRLNDRGEGEGPSPGWAWDAELEIWGWTPPVAHNPTYDVRRYPQGWYWRHSFPPHDRSIRPFTTAREAMRAADHAREAANGA